MLISLGVMASMGLVGSLHCVGMCGGLVSALSMSQPRIWWGGLLAYQSGRITSYAALGLAAGLLGGALGGLGDIVPRVLAWLAGGVMVAVGLHMAGWTPDPLHRLTEATRGRVGLVQLTTRAAQFPTPWRWYIMGVANGLLPCGLVYAALSLSLASGHPAQATLMMAAFGVGTVPAMMFAPAIVRAITPALRGNGMRVLGVIVILLGIMTVLRGGITSGSTMHPAAVISHSNSRLVGTAAAAVGALGVLAAEGAVGAEHTAFSIGGGENMATPEAGVLGNVFLQRHGQGVAGAALRAGKSGRVC